MMNTKKIHTKIGAFFCNLSA